MFAELDSMLRVTSQLKPTPTIGADLGRAFDALTPVQQREIEKQMDQITSTMSTTEYENFSKRWDAAKHQPLIGMAIIGIMQTKHFHFYNDNDCARALHSIIQYESRPKKYIFVGDPNIQRSIDTTTMVEFGDLPLIKGSDFTLQQCKDVVRLNSEITLSHPTYYFKFYRETMLPADRALDIWKKHNHQCGNTKCDCHDTQKQKPLPRKH